MYRYAGDDTSSRFDDYAISSSHTDAHRQSQYQQDDALPCPNRPSQQFCNYPGVTVEHKVVTCTATRARGLGLAHRHGRPHPFSRPQGDHLGVRHHLQPRQRHGRRIREPTRHLVLRPTYLRPARGAEIIVFFAMCANAFRPWTSPQRNRILALPLSQLRLHDRASLCRLRGDVPARHGVGLLIMDWQTPVAVAIAPLAGRYALWPLSQKPRRKPVASADSQLLQIESPDRS